MRILTKDEMYQADSYTIHTLGVPGEMLMESAAQAMTARMVTFLGVEDSIVVLAGTGNNGGDGIAIARRLRNLGYQAELWLIPKEEKVRDAARFHLDLYRQHGYPIHPYSPSIYTAISQADWIVDSLLGIGMKGSLRAPYDQLVEAVNQSRAKVLSVDIPSGVNASEAQVEQAVRADVTYTVQHAKQSAYLYPAASFYGRVETVDIGIPPAASAQATKETWDVQDYRRTRPIRNPDSNKGSHGKGLLIGGSADMIGAPALAAGACLRSGIGLLSCAVPSHVRSAIISLGIEATFLPCEEQEGNLSYVSIPEKTQVIGVGMGLGRGESSRKVVSQVLQTDCMAVLDADALYQLDMEQLRDRRRAVTVLTPHAGEFARLIGKSVPKVEENRFELSSEFAQAHSVYLVLKGPYTIVSCPNGRQFVNTSGNAGLAKGGSGDVLTGMITAFLPQYKNPQEAISNAVWLHGHCADYLVEQMAMESITASDLVRNLPFCMNKFQLSDVDKLKNLVEK